MFKLLVIFQLFVDFCVRIRLMGKVRRPVLLVVSARRFKWCSWSFLSLLIAGCQAPMHPAARFISQQRTSPLPPSHRHDPSQLKTSK